MGCGKSKHAVATVDTITKPSVSTTTTSCSDGNTKANVAPEMTNGNASIVEKEDDSCDDGNTNTNVAPETTNGNASIVEKEDDSKVVPENGELPSQVEDVKDEGKKTEGAVVPEAKEDDISAKEESKEEPQETNANNQETTPEKKTSEADVAAEIKEEDSINQKIEGNDQGPEAASTEEETVPNAEEKAAEESKQDSKAN